MYGSRISASKKNWIIICYRNLQKPEPENNNGSLTFSMHFVPSENQLRVRIIKAADLPPKDVTGTSDPYVKVQLLPETKTKYQTKVSMSPG